jgi:hypothetical protein
MAPADSQRQSGHASIYSAHLYAPTIPTQQL